MERPGTPASIAPRLLWGGTSKYTLEGRLPLALISRSSTGFLGGLCVLSAEAGNFWDERHALCLRDSYVFTWLARYVSCREGSSE